MNINTVLNLQEVVERKVKELNTLLQEAVNYGAIIQVDIQMFEMTGCQLVTQLVTDFKIDPKDLKL